MDLDDVLPRPAYRIDAVRLIRAPASVVWHELVTVTLADLPFTFGLTALRHLPAVVTRRERPVGRHETFLAETPIPVLYQDEPRQLISAGLSQSWRLFGGPVAPLLDLEQFIQWHEPGWAKVAMVFSLQFRPETGKTALATQTRVGFADPATARAFGPYWWAVKGGSALIRREVIRRVQIRAEAATLFRLPPACRHFGERT